MKKSDYKNVSCRSPGAFGFCLKPAGTKLRRLARPAPDKNRLEGRIGIQPMSLAASYFAGKRNRIG